MFERITCIYGIIVNLAGILICLFRYVEKPKKDWIYPLVFLLANLLSNYYWGVYVFVMDDYPNLSSFFAYFGWNLAFIVMSFMAYKSRFEEEKRFFSPFCLIPIIVNLPQFILYLSFGGIFNNIVQNFLATFIACVSLNSIVYYLKNKKEGAKIPYVPIACLIYIILEYIMWTSSCFDWPSEWLYPYNYATVLDFLVYLMIPWAIRKTMDADERESNEATRHIKAVFRPVYTFFMLTGCLGGYLLALWMRNVLRGYVGDDGDPFRVIAVILFVISVIIVLFSIAVILVVDALHRSSESQRLREATKLAERSNAAKSDFLANMSHEIRTPINAVLGMNEMLLKESLKAREDLPDDREAIKNTFSEICSYSGNIDSAGKSLLALINDILDFSKIEAGKLEIIEDEYKLSSVLNDVSNMISFKAKSKGLKFDINVDKDLPDNLSGDEVRVRQIITNLLNNAVKYTYEGSISLSVIGNEREKEPGSDDRITDLTFKVKDSGIGIKKEDIDKLFNKFERVDLKKNSTVEGTGLGLAITKNLIEKMDGNIEVESVYGTGSEFTVTIPQKIISDEAIGDFREKYERSISTMTARKESFKAPDAVILVVDDTIVNLTVIKGLLKNTGIKIDTANGGRKAIEAAKKTKYDLIFMDQRMPEMDGVTAMHNIREDAESLNASTPFICLTVDAVSGAKERYISEGFEDYLSKPVDSKELESKLTEYLPEEKVIYTEE